MALVSLGLLLSLLPRTSFVSYASADIVDAVGPVWPEQSVEQVLDHDLGVVSEVRIWAAAGSRRGEAPIVAALLQGPQRELVRQVRIGIKASHLLQPYVLEFAPYMPQDGEELTLQLWVSPERSNHTIFGTTERRFDQTGPTVNQNPTDKGPLAYDIIWRGDGWRAAYAGSLTDTLRLAGGIAAATLAVLLQPRVQRALRTILSRSQGARQSLPALAWSSLSRAWIHIPIRRHDTREQRSERVLYLFPWLISAFAILHFLASNLLLVRAYEAITTSVIALTAVTALFLLMRIVLNGTESAAVFVGIISIAFYSYGHIYEESAQPDDRYFIGIGIPLVVGLILVLRKRYLLTPSILQFLNLGSLVLVVLPIAQILALVFGSNVATEQANSPLARFPGLDERIKELRSELASDDLRDIYYIILDGYPRSRSPESFDNSAFERELASRGFYVDPFARSNYSRTQWSLSASLNMNYYEPYTADQEKTYELFRSANEHALGHIVNALGYKYVHVASGWYITDSSPSADLIVSLSSDGHTISESQPQDPCVVERVMNLGNEFTVEFYATTMANRFFDFDTRWLSGPCKRSWQDPSFALEWIEFMKISGRIGGPKFVLAHFLKPHEPYSFDRYGNVSPHRDGWSDDHDPTVDSAFYGQILWLNDQILEVIDQILSEYNEPPIIVIAADHGNRTGGFGDALANEILAAYLLPDGGETAVYPHITSVNVFRSILNYYFDLGFEMLDDKVYSVFQ